MRTDASGRLVLRLPALRRAVAVAVLRTALAAFVLATCTLALVGCVSAISQVTAPQSTGPSASPPQGDPTAPAAIGAIATTPATLERVVDGDTAIFHVGLRRERVRFIGINAPEDTSRIDPYGPEATAYVQRILTPGRTIYLEQDAEQRDRYGRLLSYVWLAQPSSASDSELRAKMLNAMLALDGYAQQMTVPPNVKYESRFRSYVREARLAGRGLWQGRAQGPKQ